MFRNLKPLKKHLSDFLHGYGDDPGRTRASTVLSLKSVTNPLGVVFTLVGENKRCVSLRSTGLKSQLAGQRVTFAGKDTYEELRHYLR